MSPADAETFLRQAGETPLRGEASERFRSRIFGTWRESPIAVETFGGFELCIECAWGKICLEIRVPVRVGGALIYVPSADELVRLLHSIGRRKDLERGELVATMMRGGPAIRTTPRPISRASLRR